MMTTKKLVELIDLAVGIVRESGGSVGDRDLFRRIRERVNVGGLNLYYIVNSAVADGRLEYPLRTGMVSLPGYVPPVNDLTSAERRVRAVLEEAVTSRTLDLTSPADHAVFVALVRRVTAAAAG